MNKTKVIVDVGSNHGGRLDYAKEFIDIAVDNGCWAIKFQLFKNLPPNIELPREYWPELVGYAKGRIEIFASVFDKEAMIFLLENGANYVKFAYSMRFNTLGFPTTSLYQSYESDLPKVFISCSPLECCQFCQEWLKLFCIPEYPVLYEIDFREIFRNFEFAGFSDHTLGFVQTLNAIDHGAEYIEKHIALNTMVKCPDWEIALKPKQLKEMMGAIKSCES